MAEDLRYSDLFQSWAIPCYTGLWQAHGTCDAVRRVLGLYRQARRLGPAYPAGVRRAHDRRRDRRPRAALRRGYRLHSTHRPRYDDPRTPRDLQAQQAAMTGYLDSGAPGRDALLFLPLGAAGEIGMNLTIYGHAGN